MIGFSPNSPKTKIITGLKNITFDQLRPMITSIAIGEKDGSFFTRSAFVDPTTGRKTNDSVEPLATILVIDGDSSIDLSTGEITEGAPDPVLVATVLVALGWNFILYRSYSHGTKGHRYRIVLQTNRPYTPEELEPTLDSVIHELHDAGLNIRNVSENANWSLAWYLPRRDANDTDTFTFIENTKGGPVNVCAAEQIEEKVKNAINTSKEKRQNPLGNGLIRIFNSLYNLPELLKQRGDIEKSYNRFVYSLSTSGSAGIVIFDGLMYSHHGDDPLADGEAHDSFDVYRITHNNSLTQALSQLTYQQILDYITNCGDDDILEDINRGLSFLSPQIQARVRKELKVRLDLPISVLKDEAKYFKKGLEDENAEEELESHYEIVEDFLSQFQTRPISYAAQLYTYNGTIWEAKDIEGYQNLFAERYKSNPLCKRAQDYIALSKLLYTTCFTKKSFFKNAPHGIAINYEFYTVNDTGAICKEPLTHAHKQRIHYDFELDTNPPIEWLETLDKTFDDQDEINVLQEIFAAALFGMFPSLKKAALLKGTGDSGKSTILSILEDFVPKALRSASSPADWGNKEFLGNIAGKALNAVGEMDYKRRMSGNDFKKVIGNDVCEGRKLYLGVFNFHNTAAHIFNTNEFPPTSATDKAFFTRWVILNFKKEIPKSERIIDYDKKLLAKERSQILNWILEGAKRLIVNEVFTELPEHEKLIREWEASVNPFLAFIQDETHIITTPNALNIKPKDREYYSNDQIYKLYELWCRANNTKNLLAPVKLIQKMKENHIIFRNPDNNHSRMYTGITLGLDFSYSTKVNMFDTDGIWKHDYKGNKI